MNEESLSKLGEKGFEDDNGVDLPVTDVLTSRTCVMRADKDSICGKTTDKVALMFPDYVWCDKLLRLKVNDAVVNHFLAWLSTLGGAYHLCNHPKHAMAIARITIGVGCYIHNPRLALKGHVYVALNYCMIGKCIELCTFYGCWYVTLFCFDALPL
jgi:hypothetical protein